MKKISNFLTLAFGLIGTYLFVIPNAQAGPYITYEFVDLDIGEQQCFLRANRILRDAGLGEVSNHTRGGSSYVYAHGESPEFTVFIDCSRTVNNRTQAIIFVGGDNDEAYQFRGALAESLREDMAAF